MTYAETVSTVAAATLTPGTTRVRAIASRTGFVRVFDNTLGGTSAAASANLPLLSVVATNSVAGAVSGPVIYDDARPWYRDGALFGNDGTALVGTYKVQVVPVAGSPDASSVQIATLAPGDLIVLATG